MFEGSFLLKKQKILQKHKKKNKERERERGGGGQKNKADLFSEQSKAIKNVFCLSGGDV